MIPEKLKQGDEIRIIAPARSMGLLSEENKKTAKQKLESLGFKVTFAEHVDEKDEFISSSIQSRVKDLHAAFADKNVKAILTVIGGFNSNQLLRYIDYDLIKKNPKILCGYSDITALGNAIYQKTGLVTYSGPHFSTFGMEKGLEYTIEYFKKCLMQDKPFEVEPSKKWSDDEWWTEQEKRDFIDNKGYLVVNEGTAEGTIIGGNQCTFNLLQGTEYRPKFKNTILFLEDDEEVRAHHFDRDLQSIIHLPDFSEVKAIVIGRFQKVSEMTEEKIRKIIKTKKELEKIPVIANADFGHTTPHITFPIGGTAKVYAKGRKVKLEIIKH
ncbi:LD-carboxypeptidase [Candidatus Woesearchaeota archaeon]|nr:LD-carboxypeptidase [Candidatus Woesearchaeota archaeon]MBW3005857.1 LD-carboxypeptidase [Candidatus Woesearchaeota archaeon]